MNATVKTNDSQKPSNAFNYLAAGVVVLGIVLYYALKINLWLKWGIVLLSVIAAGGIFFFISPTGLNLHNYVKDSWRELDKVVWPTRKEAVQFTWIVFLFVLILGLFLWIVDSSLSWLFYNVILGRVS
jgi:preprotein translocase subunit SecE